MMKSAFLKAEWRKLLMVNYAVDQKVLQRHLPHKTAFDHWNGQCYVSLVGFMFLNTHVKGLKIPFHVNFQEVNLRFYVRYKDQGFWKRGVVFIKEIVPRPAISLIANAIYKEHYETLPMSHQWQTNDHILTVAYRWKKQDEWNTIQINTVLESSDIEAGSEEEFITEHYWGYTRINDHATAEYGVEHPRWRVYEKINYSIDVNFAVNYGEEFSFLNHESPKSVFLAEGSEVTVRVGRNI
jgi:uncharacterized protein